MDTRHIVILSGRDVAQCLDMKMAIQAMEKAFCQLSSHRAKVPLRTGLEIEEHNGISLFMPAYLPESRQIALKTVCVFKDNPQKNLPAIHAMVQVFDAQTGIPLAVMDGEVLTALRTGAASGLATKILANESAQVAAIMGAGVQGRTQLEAVCSVRNIQQALVFDLSEKKSRQFAQQMSEKLSIPIVPMNKMDELKNADIICTATPSDRALFDHSVLKKGVHINGIGSYRPDMCEIPAETVKTARVFVDQKQACLSEAGDLIGPLEKGIIDENHIRAELGEVILGLKKGRCDKDDITFFKTVGIAVQDLAAADLILKKARQLGLGSVVEI